LYTAYVLIIFSNDSNEIYNFILWSIKPFIGTRIIYKNTTH